MLRFHEIANIFPMIEGKPFDEFADDIRDNDLQESIALLDGAVLDGRNRYKALLRNGAVAENTTAGSLLAHDARFFDFAVKFPGVDPLTWVLSHNKHRRHLEPSQWAAVGANMETLKQGRPREGKDAKLHLTRTEIAGIVPASPRLIASASKVKREGAAELFEAVAQGKVKANVAEKLLTLPKAKQIEAATLLDARKLPTLAKKVKRADTELRLAGKQRALPDTLYNVILADPAWRFEPYSRDTGLDRAADNHYPTQATGDIKSLPVGTLAAPDAVLFLWATAPMLCDALAVMRFWGFEYKSHTVWRKAEPSHAGSRHSAGLVLGTGYWFRNGHELLLVGTRGNIPAPAPGEQWASILDAAPRRHSQKPDFAYELIEAYFPNLPKIELNARAARGGWAAWGLEAPENSPETASGGAGGESSPPPAGGEGAAGQPNVLPVTSRDAYLMALAASTIEPGSYSRATAAPIVRAAYGCEPIIPVMQQAEDLGHPVGTILTWASRLGLTRTERRQAHRFVAGGGLNDGAAGEGGHRDV